MQARKLRIYFAENVSIIDNIDVYNWIIKILTAYKKKTVVIINKIRIENLKEQSYLFKFQSNPQTNKIISLKLTKQNYLSPSKK